MAQERMSPVWSSRPAVEDVTKREIIIKPLDQNPEKPVILAVPAISFLYLISRNVFKFHNDKIL